MFCCFLAIIAASLLATSISATPLSETDLLTRFGFDNSTNGVTGFALLYGYGLYAWMKAFQGAVFIQGVGTNKFYDTGRLATPASRTVVAPNVDTIYALAVLDLAHQDVVVTLPPMQDDRFYLLAFFDP